MARKRRTAAKRADTEAHMPAIGVSVTANEEFFNANKTIGVLQALGGLLKCPGRKGFRVCVCGAVSHRGVAVDTTTCWWYTGRVSMRCLHRRLVGSHAVPRDRK